MLMSLSRIGLLAGQAGAKDGRQQLYRSVVMEPVEDISAFLAVEDQARLPQDSKLLGDVRLRLSEDSRQVTDALLRAPQHIEDLQSHRVRHKLQPFGFVVIGVHMQNSLYSDYCMYYITVICSKKHDTSHIGEPILRDAAISSPSHTLFTPPSNLTAILKA